MTKCPICNGRTVQKDKYGITEECELCGTEFTVRAYKKGEKSKKEGDSY